MAPRTDKMKRFLWALGVSVKAYDIWTGRQPLNAFHAANPTWTQRSWEILVLENIELLKANTADTHSPA